MKFKTIKQTASGLNTEFINLDSGRLVSLEHAIKQINKGNPNYDNYNAVNMPNETTYIRSNADCNEKNNIERGTR